MTEKELYLSKLGKRIAELRKEKGLSQNELSYIIDCDKPNYRKIEKGKRNVTVGTLLKISEALEISMSDLFKFE